MEKEQKRLFTAIEHASDGIEITDENAVIQYVNPAFERITGYTHEEAIGQTPRIHKSGLHPPSFYGEMWQTLTAGNTWRGRITNRHKKGHLIEEEVSITPVTDTDGRITNYVAVKRDVTRELKREKQLRQAQKMEAIGTLAGGIAHDFNNILAAIMGYTELCIISSGKEGHIHKDLKKVLAAAGRAKDLVRQILTFSRDTETEKKAMAIHPIVKEVRKLLSATLPAEIEIQQLIEDSATRVHVMADPVEIHQVLMNLCTNAAHAMGKTGGRLTVGLKKERLEKQGIFSQAILAPGEYLNLWIADTGHGIESHILDRIFDPYFTTKKKGEGTGLGLSTVHGIVKGLGGGIDVKSRVGRGSIFNIYLPTVAKVRAEQPGLKMPRAENREKILFIDDEIAITEISSRMLTRLGYQVTSYNDGLQALDIFRQAPRAYDLVVTDMSMPKISGDMLAKEFMKIRPDVPVILCTGYSQKIDADGARKLGIKAFVMKPIQKENLATTVRNILDQQNQNHSMESPA